MPNDWTVIVLADRGLYARWLYRRIVRLGWHPFLRINTGGTFRPEGQRRAEPLKTLVPEPGTAWAGRGTAFSGPSRRLACTLLARWDEGYKDPWLMVTDLAPEASEAAWYGVRAWIEQSFKVAKRGGWQWQRTRMTDAERATRLWLAIAVATLWLLRVGGEAEATMPDSTLLDVTGRCPHRPRAPDEALASGQCLSSWVESDHGGVAVPGAIASGAVHPSSLAHGTGARRGDLLAAAAGSLRTPTADGVENV